MPREEVCQGLSWSHITSLTTVITCKYPGAMTGMTAGSVAEEETPVPRSGPATHRCVTLSKSGLALGPPGTRSRFDHHALMGYPEVNGA